MEQGKTLIVFPLATYWKYKLNITGDETLEQAEQDITIATIKQISFSQPPYDFNHLKKIHSIIFGHIYEWAGQTRTIDISKGTTRFCNANRIEPESTKIFKKLAKQNNLIGLDKRSLIAQLAALHDDLNVLHPFREGNGRTLRVFLEHIMLNCGYGVDWLKVTRTEWLEANIRSYAGDCTLLEQLFERVILNIDWT